MLLRSIEPNQPGIRLVKKKDRKNAAAAIPARDHARREYSGQSSRTPRPPMVMEIRFGDVTRVGEHGMRIVDGLDADDEARRREGGR